MPDWMWLILACFSVYVLARTLTREEGPWQMFTAWRNQTGRWASNQNPVTVWLADIFHCPYCLSGYFCLAAAIIYTLHFGTEDQIMTTILVWFGMYGAVTLMLVVEDRGS